MNYYMGPPTTVVPGVMASPYLAPAAQQNLANLQAQHNIAAGNAQAHGAAGHAAGAHAGAAHAHPHVIAVLLPIIVLYGVYRLLKWLTLGLVHLVRPRRSEALTEAPTEPIPAGFAPLPRGADLNDPYVRHVLNNNAQSWTANTGVLIEDRPYGRIIDKRAR